MEFTISKFAKAVNTTVRTLRHYEKIGLLVPVEKNQLNQKIYTREELKKYHNIQLLKTLNMPLNSIKESLESQEFSFQSMLDIQEAVLLNKRQQISTSLDMIGRIKDLLNETGNLNTEDLMLLMNSIRLEDDQKLILKDYISSSTLDNLFPKSKSQQKMLDKLGVRLLNFFQEAVLNDLQPESDMVQVDLEQILSESPISIVELIDSYEAPFEENFKIQKALLPNNMEEFIGEALQIFLKRERGDRSK